MSICGNPLRFTSSKIPRVSPSGRGCTLPGLECQQTSITIRSKVPKIFVAEFRVLQAVEINLNHARLGEAFSVSAGCFKRQEYTGQNYGACAFEPHDFRTVVTDWSVKKNPTLPGCGVDYRIAKYPQERSFRQFPVEDSCEQGLAIFMPVLRHF